MSPPRAYTHPEMDEIVLARVLYALSDPIRLEMVRRLSLAQEADSLDLADNLARSTLTYHTRILRENGVTFTRSHGRSCLISLRTDDLEDRFPGLLQSLLTSLEAEEPGIAKADGS
ncbi:ArsR/SmtB family transcription factor [Dermacoccus abyssi]